MLKNSLITSLVMLSTIISVAQVAKESGASGYFSLNNLSNQAPAAITSAFNPAALAKIKNSSAGIFGEQRFLLKELAFYNFALALHTKPGNFGINGYYSGSVEFNSMSVGAAYGRSLGETVDIGIQFDYSSYQLKGYGKASFIYVQMGSIFHLTEQFHAGIHIKNLAGFGSDQNSEELNPLITIGLGFDASENFFAAIAFQKEMNRQNDVQAMIRYKLQNKISLKAGLAAQIPVAYAGISFTLKNFVLDIISSHHPQLGITPGLSLQYHFQNAQE